MLFYNGTLALNRVMISKNKKKKRIGKEGGEKKTARKKTDDSQNLQNGKWMEHVFNGKYPAGMYKQCKKKLEIGQRQERLLMANCQRLGKRRGRKRKQGKEMVLNSLKK